MLCFAASLFLISNVFKSHITLNMPTGVIYRFELIIMMSGSKGASAPFGIHDIVFELARKHYIMYPKMARSAFDPDIISFGYGVYYNRNITR